jgi:hypothetical protein
VIVITVRILRNYYISIVKDRTTRKKEGSAGMIKIKKNAKYLLRIIFEAAVLAGIVLLIKNNKLQLWLAVFVPTELSCQLPPDYHRRDCISIVIFAFPAEDVSRFALPGLSKRVIPENT